MISSWPKVEEQFNFPEEEEKVGILMDAIRKIRNVRAEMNVPNSRKAAVIIVTGSEKIGKMFTGSKLFLDRLASVSGISVTNDKARIPKTAVTAVFDGGEIFIPLEDLIDIEKEIQRLEAESANLENEINRVVNKLSNEKFTSRAPAEVVEQEKKKQEKYIEMKKGVDERIFILTEI